MHYIPKLTIRLLKNTIFLNIDIVYVKKNSNFKGTFILEVTVKNIAYGKKAGFFCTYTFFFVPLHAKLLKRKRYEYENRLEETAALCCGNCGICGDSNDLLCTSA